MVLAIFAVVVLGYMYRWWLPEGGQDRVPSSSRSFRHGGAAGLLYGNLSPRDRVICTFALLCAISTFLPLKIRSERRRPFDNAITGTQTEASGEHARAGSSAMFGLLGGFVSMVTFLFFLGLPAHPGGWLPVMAIGLYGGALSYWIDSCEQKRGRQPR